MNTRKGNEPIVYQAVLSGELEIDSDGRIWRLSKRVADRWGSGTKTLPCKRIRAENAGQLGYLQIRTMIDGKRFAVMAHRLVWLHFRGAIPVELTINHKNGDKRDNRPVNLELVTLSENRRHALDVLNVDRNHPKGEKNPKAQATEQDVRVMRQRRAAGEQIKSIASAFKMKPKAVSAICCRRTWKHIP